MKTYEIKIQEVLSRRVEVQAESEEEALQQVADAYSNQEIILCSDDYDGEVEIIAVTTEEKRLLEDSLLLDQAYGMATSLFLTESLIKDIFERTYIGELITETFEWINQEIVRETIVAFANEIYKSIKQAKGVKNA